MAALSMLCMTASAQELSETAGRCAPLLEAIARPVPQIDLSGEFALFHVRAREVFERHIGQELAKLPEKRQKDALAKLLNPSVEQNYFKTPLSASGYDRDSGRIQISGDVWPSLSGLPALAGSFARLVIDEGHPVRFKPMRYTFQEVFDPRLYTRRVENAALQAEYRVAREILSQQGERGDLLAALLLEEKFGKFQGNVLRDIWKHLRFEAISMEGELEAQLRAAVAREKSKITKRDLEDLVVKAGKQEAQYLAWLRNTSLSEEDFIREQRRHPLREYRDRLRTEIFFKASFYAWTAAMAARLYYVGFGDFVR